MDRLLRHIAACNNARLPGERLPFRIGAVQVGWVRPALAERIAGFPGLRRKREAVVLEAERADDLQSIARRLAEQGVIGWRDEPFDVRAEPDGPVLTRLDRAALPVFGIEAQGVHVNGLVRRNGGLWVWVGRRALDKQLEPGKYDHIVAGGVPAGLAPAEALVKEAAEEAGIPLSLAAEAVPVARIAYAMERPEGLRRDVLHCYDLTLPADFVPHPADGEVSEFALWPLEQALGVVAETDDFKFNVSLVMIDLFLRTGLIDPASEQGRALRRALGS